jgi:hypothetical protein
VQYLDGSHVALGDVVDVPIPSGSQHARVVMLGDSYAHLPLDPSFLEWVVRDRVLRADSVVVEWLGANPFAHDDPSFAPVGNYMFTAVDKHLLFVARAAQA